MMGVVAPVSTSPQTFNAFTRRSHSHLLCIPGLVYSGLEREEWLEYHMF